MMHAAILAVHIGMGTLGLVSGAAALLLRKGAGPHRAVGTVFVLAMVCMGITASILAVMTSQPGMVVGGIAATYFIVTAWMAARRKDGETGAFEIAAFVAGLVLGPGVLALTLVTGPATDPHNPYLPFAQYSFDGIMTLAAIGDFSVIARRGISGVQRIARHLWRMCFGLFIAVGSFAAQGAKILPPGVGAKVLLASMIIVVAVMVYWLVRVLLTKWYAQTRQAQPA